MLEIGDLMYSSTRFSQILNLLPKGRFNKYVQIEHADKYTKTFKSNDLLNIMIYGQLSKAKSLRNLVDGYNSHSTNKAVARSTFSEGLSNRSDVPFKNLCELLIKQLSRKDRHECSEYLTLIDSTPIPLNLKKHKWATERSGNRFNGLKVHMAIESGDSRPLYANITPANINDISDIKDHFILEKGATYVMDKGYTDYNWWHKINEKGAFFITRIKKNAALKVMKTHETKADNIELDQTIYLTNRKARGKAINHYTNKDLRRVTVCREDGKFLVIITNDFDRSAEEIAYCYKKRWQIELFFKWLKQKLKLKSFFGLSENAVKIQIYCVLISYLLMHQLKKLSTQFSHISEVEIWLQHGLLIRDRLEKYRERQKKKRYYCLKFQEILL